MLDLCTGSHKSSSFTRRKSRTSNNPVPVLRSPSKYGWMSCILTRLRHKLQLTTLSMTRDVEPWSRDYFGRPRGVFRLRLQPTLRAKHFGGSGSDSGSGQNVAAPVAPASHTGGGGLRQCYIFKFWTITGNITKLRCWLGSQAKIPEDTKSFAMKSTSQGNDDSELLRI